MLTRRARLLVSFATGSLLLLFVVTVAEVLGFVGENFLATALQDRLERVPAIQAVLAYSKQHPEYGLLIMLGLALTAVIGADVVMSRSVVDIGMDDPVLKPMRGGYTAAYLFFNNLSRSVGDAATAREITARITAWGTPISSRDLSASGVWAVTDVSTFVTATGKPVRTWTFPPNDEPGKLYLLVRGDNESNALICCQETLDAKTDDWGWRGSTAFILPYGEYLIRVRLRGVGNKSTHWVRVLNDASGMTIEPLGVWTKTYRLAFRFSRWAMRLAFGTEAPSPSPSA